MKWVAKDVCAAFGVDRRTVTNWLNEEVPVPSAMEGSRRVFVAADVVAWFSARAVRHARSAWEKERPKAEDEVKEARNRQVIAESRMAELELAEREGQVIPAELYEQRVRAIVEPLAARCKSLSKYMGDVQVATTDVDAAALLDRIGDDLLKSFLGVADEVSDENPDEVEVAA
jgi:hypothetical protein